MAKTETTAVLLRLAPELLAAIDQMRRETPRSIYIRNRLADIVGQRPQVLRSMNAGVVLMHKVPPMIEQLEHAKSVPFGPAKSDPGSRLKKPKGGKP